MRSLAIDEIRAALIAQPARVLKHFDVDFQDRGSELRTRNCPACGPRSSRAVCISADTGTWFCHPHGCHGDVLDLVAGYAGLNSRTAFPRVLELGAVIAGVSADHDHRERDRRRLEQQRQAEARRRQDAEQRAAKRRAIEAEWATMARRHPAGERYLRDRGLEPDRLHAVPDLLRYTVNGEPALALRDLATGETAGLQWRKLTGNPKIHTASGSQVARSALAGRLSDLDPAGADVAVAVEGLADTLAAHLQWPGCAIFGAPGAAQLPTIVAAVAHRVREVGGWLLMAIDDDEAGVKAAAQAIVEAVDAGLRLASAAAEPTGSCSVRLVQLGDHHDLADAHAAGWRYSSQGGGLT